jgi:hypothetical protein
LQRTVNPVSNFRLGTYAACPQPHLTDWGLLETLTLQPLALQLPGAANSFRCLSGPTLRRFLIMPPQLHFAENTLPLHLFLERLERLVNVVVTHEDLHLAAFSYG